MWVDFSASTAFFLNASFTSCLFWVIYAHFLIHVYFHFSAGAGTIASASAADL